MVLAAILIPVIVIFAGLAWGTAMVYGANQEGRRAADLAALASAAEMPTFNLSAACQTNPTGFPDSSTTTTTAPGGTGMGAVEQPQLKLASATRQIITVPTTVTIPPTTVTIPPTTVTIPPTTTTSVTIPPTTTTSVTVPPTTVPPTTIPSTPNPQNIPCVQQIGNPQGPFTLKAPPSDPFKDLSIGECGLATDQFLNNRSLISEIWHGDSPPSCTPEPVYTNPWEQQLADCLANYNAVANCTSQLQDDVKSKLVLPGPADQLTQQVQALVQAATGTTVNPCQAPFPAQACTATNTLYTQIANVQGQVCSLAGQAAGCLQPLLDNLGQNSIDANLRELAPALLTPAIKVTIKQDVRVPGLSMLGVGHQTITNTATARRVFKNAVVIPVLKAQQTAGGPIPLDPNEDIAQIRDPALTLLRGLNAQLTPVLNQAMQTICPPNQTCSVDDAFGDQIDDVSDIVNPPTGGTGPTAKQVYDSGKALLISPVKEMALSADPQHPLKTTVCSGSPGGVKNCLDVVTANALKTVLGIPNILYIPALQVVPATISNTYQACPLITDVVKDPQNLPSNLPDCTTDLVDNATALHGLFRARLVHTP